MLDNITMYLIFSMGIVDFLYKSSQPCLHWLIGRTDMNPDWEKLGKDVQHIVEDAVSTQNFNQLNKAITNTVNEAVGNIRKGLRTAEEKVNKEWNRKNYRWYSSSENVFDKKKQSQAPNLSKNKISEESAVQVRKAGVIASGLFRKNTGVKAGGITLTICGAVFNVGLGMAVVILCLVSLFLGSFPVGIRIALSILLPLLVGIAIMTVSGSRMLSALKIYRAYIETLGGKTYCNIKELAGMSEKSASYVVKDIKKMIAKGWFIQGHLDEQNTCLIVSDDTYHEYEELKKQRLQQQQSEQIKVQKKTEQLQNTVENEQLQKVMEKGQEYVDKIRSCNDAISGVEISDKISHMETLIQKIFDRVSADPDSLEDIDKMMEYYLPTTVKLLEAYQSLSEQPVQGENIKSSKIEIENTLDTLNGAFEKLLDSLFEDVAWDVSSDISVLHTMLAQEGLTGNEGWKSKGE